MLPGAQTIEADLVGGGADFASKRGPDHSGKLVGDRLARTFAMPIRPALAVTIAALALAQMSAAHAQRAPLIDMAAAEAKAEATVKQMTADEKVVITHGC